MPQRTATIGSLPEAFGMVKAMRAGGPDWDTGCRQAAREAPAGIIRDRMAEDVDRWPGSPEGRNGTCRRRLPCEPGDIGPGCRGPAAAAPPPCWGATRAAPRGPGLPCRPRARFVHPQDRRDPAAPARAPGPARHRQPRDQNPGRRRRRLTDRSKALMPDGVAPARKTGAGAAAVADPEKAPPGNMPAAPTPVARPPGSPFDPERPGT